MYIYIPNSVELQENCQVKRAIHYPNTTTELDRTKEDVKTIFYDVFVSPHTKKLCCIGPKLYNLKRELFPLAVFVEGQRVPFKYYQIERLFFLESIPLTGQYSDTINIEFKFKKFDKYISINWQEDVLRAVDYSDCPLSISTLQKDNNIEWISDWILWHRRLYDVKRVVLYDNGSSNRVQLTEFLPSLEPEVRIILVHWPFPHGIAPYKSAQHGSLNHCRLKFPVSNGYCINLDIDEYLVKSINEPLLTYLKRTLKFPSPGVVLFKPKIVPNTIPNQQNSLPRCFDFKYRYSTPDNNQHSKKFIYFRYLKYIYKYENVGYNAPHRTNSDKNRSFCQRFSFLYILRFHFVKSIWKIKRLLLLTYSEKPKIDSYTAPESDLYFFHFMGLTTGWRKIWNNKPYCSTDSSIHIPEPKIENLAKESRLTESR